MTRLTVAIPTRNRAELAMTAVESVLSAGQPGVSVVVSDNSTVAGDHDRLADFCSRQPADLVRYVRPPEPLAMPAHWEWLWQLLKREVAPTHVTYLTDRMVFVAGALEELLRIVERHPEEVISYQYDRVDDAETPVDLVQAQWTGDLLELDTRTLLELSSRVIHGDHLPRMLNSIAPASVLTALEERFGNVFRPVSPDYCFAYRHLATADSFLYLDRSCVIHYGIGRSSGHTFMKGRPNEDAADFARQMAVARFGATPEPMFETVNNAICQEYCTVREEVGGSPMPPLDWWWYLAANAVSIDRIEEPQWRARLTEVLRSRGWTRRDAARYAAGQALAMAGYFASNPDAFAQSLRRQLWDRPPGTPLGRLLGRLGVNPRVRDDLRFPSATDAIAYANEHPRPPMRCAWHVYRLARAGAIRRTVPEPPAFARPPQELSVSETSA